MLWSAKLTRRRILTYILAIVLLLIFVTVMAVGYTPVRELIPGYPTRSVRQMIVRNAVLVDSLEYQIQIRDEFIDKFRIIANGGVPLEYQQAPDSMANEPMDIELTPFDHDTVFRQQLLEEKINLSVPKDDIRQHTMANTHFFTPLAGMVSQKFDKSSGHYAVDVVGMPNARICSVLAGTVIAADWTLQTGYVIFIQHENNLVSVYKHNSELLKAVGDEVDAGEVIAFMGNTGELSTGPHLHFELWFKGIPLDPEEYIDF
jgi:hypothetical protein